MSDIWLLFRTLNGIYPKYYLSTIKDGANVNNIEECDLETYRAAIYVENNATHAGRCKITYVI